MITGSAWESFLDSVKRDGVTEEIVLTPDGKQIIDGRNRYKACKKLGIVPPIRLFGSRPTDGTSVVGFIIRSNLQRRQLDDSQRAMVGAKLSKLGRGRKAKDGSELTQADIKALLNVSGATLSRAKRANDKGTRAIRAMIEEQEISVSVGAALAGLPADEQNKLACEGPVACRERATEIMRPEKSEAIGHTSEKLLHSQAYQIREKDFYESFAKWLKEEFEECTKAIPLGRNRFKDKWGTPDVVGKLEPRRSDIVQCHTVIVAAEIKLDMNELMTAFGQACAYCLFAHKSYLVVPANAPKAEIARIAALCDVFGIGMVIFDDQSPQNPDFRIRVTPRRHEPNMSYMNQYMKHIERELFS
jgi:hypothetical protein